MKKILFLTNSAPPPAKIWTDAFRQALAEREFRVEHLASESLSAEELITKIREHEVLLLSWESPMLPDELAAHPGALRYICHLTGSVRNHIPEAIIESDIVVTNWGDSIGPSVAEGALTLMLACLKNIRPQIEDKLGGAWVIANADSIGSLQNLKLGLYGFGHIGRCFYELVKPLGPDLRVYDPYTPALPDDCQRVGSLRELFSDSEAVAIFAALTDETRETVDGSLLRMLPDQGIIINTARGDIIRQDDLFAEVASGRLRAGLDVLADPDWLPMDHKALRYRNLILTSHRAGDSYWQTHISNEAKRLAFFHKTCLENLICYRNKQPLNHVIGRLQYGRMT